MTIFIHNKTDSDSPGGYHTPLSLWAPPPHPDPKGIPKGMGTAQLNYRRGGD